MTDERTLYGLFDPRNGELRYIGVTEKPLDLRLTGHCSGPANGLLREWLTELKPLRPEIRPLRTLTGRQWWMEERDAIREAAANGARLCNVMWLK
jgi:hypothetical protein